MIIADKNLTDDERRSGLKDILFELSQSEETLKTEEAKDNYYKRLINIYVKRDGSIYRHYYSDILQVVIRIDEENFEGNVDVLLQNISILINNYNYNRVFMAADQNDGSSFDERAHKRSYVVGRNFCKVLNKLYDHVNLEIERMNYSKVQSIDMKMQMKRTLDSAKKIDKSFLERHNELQEQIKKNNEEMESIKEDMHRQQKEMQQEYVAILGIFASIVLAFVGGLTFSTSVLKYINAVSVHRLIVIVSIIGATTFDIIWLLTFFIYKIAINRDNNVNKILMGVLGGINFGFLIAIVSTVVHYLKFK